MEYLSIKVKNYKCFGDEPVGFESIKPINIIIGRNNSGKSTLLELIHFLVGQKTWFNNFPTKIDTALLISQSIDEPTIRRVFVPGTSGGGIPGDHFKFGLQLLNGKCTFSVFKETRTFIETNLPFIDSSISRYSNDLANKLVLPFSNSIIARINAERNIQPEQNGESIIYPNGNGATTIIQNFINDVNLDSSKVENVLLTELNKIMHPDCFFKDIVVQRLGDSKWEIFLEEETKGRIALSASGSGLQTIILVLINLHLLPILKSKPLSSFIFCFEELENNLHPSLQRRLFSYLRSFISTEQSHPVFFITTHSNVVIDLFANDQETAQLIHVKNASGLAEVSTVSGYTGSKNLIADLGFKASDLLQANCLIWVEGPTDRIYFNKWISLWAPDLKEGLHYQCVFYGGRLLLHLSYDLEGVEINDFISTLRVNSNAVVIIDSDKKTFAADINATKKRVCTEITNNGGYVWVTAGREVENYIPNDVLNILYPEIVGNSLSKFGDIGKFLSKIDKKKETWFENNKVLFARNTVTHLTHANLSSQYDLYEKMTEIIAYIRKCN